MAVMSYIALNFLIHCSSTFNCFKNKSLTGRQKI
uniref:Uncharacterized protein n=1 Tax=Anguilla anguilla TaxID=7936 RepID=A0A0E9TYA6_ANGAN